MRSYQKQTVDELNAEIEARGKFAAKIGLQKKLEALVKELPAEFLARFEADVRAFGIDVQNYTQSLCEGLAHQLLRDFDLTTVEELRGARSPGQPGWICRRNFLPEPFWCKEDRTPAKEKKIRSIREQNRKLAKAA